MYKNLIMQKIKINEQMRVNAQQRLLILLKIRLNDIKIARNNAIIARNNAIIAKLMAEEKAEKNNAEIERLDNENIKINQELAQNRANLLH